MDAKIVVYDNSQHLVEEFNKKFDLPINDIPTLINKNYAKHRVELIREEINELLDAIEEDNILEIADALTDIKYLVEGTSLSYGFNMKELFEEVHRSNMSKDRDDENPTKLIVKGENYFKPNIKKILFGE